MAALVKRGQKWSVVYMGTDGKQKWVKGYTDKAETQRLAHRLEDDKTRMLRGEIDPAVQARKAERAKPIGAHIDAYQAHLEAKGSSRNHVSYTIADIKRLVAFADITSAAQITWGLVDTWLADLKKGERPDSPNTMNRRVGSVKAFLRHLHRQGGVADYVLEKYPKLKTKGLETRKRRALSQAEVNALLKKTPQGRKLIYRFALLTGFRYSEIASLTPASFNFDALTITVKASDAKNKSRDQTVPMAARLVKDLKKAVHEKRIGERVLSMPTRSEAAKVLRDDCVAAKVDTTHVDFHALRHTFITRLAEGQIHPKILQELARHSSVETTLRYYVHFRTDSERSAIDALAA